MLSRLPSPVWVKLVPLMVAAEATSEPSTWPVRPLRYSRTTGFFFCGMMLEVPATLSGKSMRANSWVDQTKKSCATRLQNTASRVICAMLSRAKSREPTASRVFSR